MGSGRGAGADLTAGGVLVGLAAVGLRALARHPDLTAYDFGAAPGPGLLPRLLLWALAAGGGALMAGAIWTLVRSGRPGISRVGGRRWVLPALFALSLGGYVAVLRTVGFLATTAVFAALWILVLTRHGGEQLSVRTGARAVAAAVGITAAVYYVFTGFVKVPLP
jgi:hypothetical protein